MPVNCMSIHQMHVYPYSALRDWNIHLIGLSLKKAIIASLAGCSIAKWVLSSWEAGLFQEASLFVIPASMMRSGVHCIPCYTAVNPDSDR